METGIYRAGIKTGQDLILRNANMAEILGQAKQEGRREVVNWLLDVLLGERGLLNRVVAQSQLDQNRAEMVALMESLGQAHLDHNKRDMEYWREKCYNDTMSAKKSGWDDCRKFYKTKMAALFEEIEKNILWEDTFGRTLGIAPSGNRAFTAYQALKAKYLK